MTDPTDEYYGVTDTMFDFLDPIYQNDEPAKTDIPLHTVNMTPSPVAESAPLQPQYVQQYFNVDKEEEEDDDIDNVEAFIHAADMNHKAIEEDMLLKTKSMYPFGPSLQRNAFRTSKAKFINRRGIYTNIFPQTPEIGKPARIKGINLTLSFFLIHFSWRRYAELTSKSNAPFFYAYVGTHFFYGPLYKRKDLELETYKVIFELYPIGVSAVVVTFTYSKLAGYTSSTHIALLGDKQITIMKKGYATRNIVFK